MSSRIILMSVATGKEVASPQLSSHVGRWFHFVIVAKARIYYAGPMNLSKIKVLFVQTSKRFDPRGQNGKIII